MADNKNNQPDYTNADYSTAVNEMTAVQDVCEGTEAVRKKGLIYLPRHFAEQEDSYKARLAVATLYPATARTWQGLVGMVFRREIKLAADVPAVIRGEVGAEEKPKTEGHWENIDNAGTHGSLFAQHSFECAVRDGHSAIFVDMPTELPPGATQADEEGRRPHWVHYEKSQILLPIRTVVENGQLFIQQIRFRERSSEPDGEFGEVVVERIRVLKREWVKDEAGNQSPKVSWQLYKKVKNDKGEDAWIDDGNGKIVMPGKPGEIPVTFVYTRKTGLGKSCPPLTAMAEQNLKHYRHESNLEKSLNMAIAIPCAAGVDPAKTKIVVGTESLMTVEKAGDFWFAEATGTGIKPLQEEIDKTESRMAKIGLSLLEPKAPQPTTATENILDSIKEESELSTWVKWLKDAIERCLGWHAAYLNEKSGGSLEITATLQRIALAPEKLRVLADMQSSDQLTLETLWDLMARAEELPEGFEKKKEQQGLERVKAEKAAQQQAMGAAFGQGFDRGGFPPGG